jgi:hypothetical protein
LAALSSTVLLARTRRPELRFRSTITVSIMHDDGEGCLSACGGRLPASRETGIGKRGMALYVARNIKRHSSQS